ncbi:MAG TPA: hypothetical protein VLC46_22660 [Thermoanaerobaculia bacterium]|jgi:hypothetical protein|nr:hypothetical protein [Thermoanaerobaculia bacterium]
MKSRRYADAALALLLTVVAIVVYRKVLRLWWMFDDPYHLGLLGGTKVTELATRAFWHQFARPLFTPLFFASLKLDLALFGANAERLYLHQLLAFALIPPLFYLALRLWLRTSLAFAAAFMAIFGVPVASVVSLLMLRHYIEGAVFALASVLLFVRGLRGDRYSLAIASAVLFLAAMFCKEIYVPLIAILVAIPESTPRQRIRLLIPHAVAAALYGVARIAMVGIGVGSYGWAVETEKRSAVLATLPLRAFAQLIGERRGIAAVLPAAIVICILIVAIRFRRSVPLMLIGLASALLPIIPVAAQLQPRWSFVLWLLVIAAAAFAPRAMPRVGTAVFAVAFIAAIAIHRTEWPRMFREDKRMSDEARVVAMLGPDDVLRNPSTPAVTMAQLESFTHAAGKAYYDDLPLCEGRRVGRIFAYDEGAREVREMPYAILSQSCAAVRPGAALSVRMNFADDGSMFWTTGPYTRGQYTFILSDGLIAYDVPRAAGFREPGLDRFNLRVRYVAPEGWRTYSPILPVDVHGKPVVFERR